MPDPLDRFKRTMPYASEAFGVYQPLLGWRAKRAVDRFARGLEAQELALFKLIHASLKPLAQVTFDATNAVNPIDWILPAYRQDYSTLPFSPEIQSWVALGILIEKDQFPGWTGAPAQWDALLSWNNLSAILNSPQLKQAVWSTYQTLVSNNVPDQHGALLYTLVDTESIVAGALNQMSLKKMYAQLERLFSRPADPVDIDAYLALKEFIDPLQSFDPKKDLNRVSLSPIGLVHLYRQYFFEFDSFLGSPVQHIWLSPGGTVELVEISTRKTTVERTTETTFESTLKSEKSSTDQDELSDAVKDENESNSKFGATVSGTERFVFGEANESASMEFGSTQKQSRESTHKTMRQQTAKLTSEIKKSFKSTFRTVTETTDTSSKRYVLANSSDKLVNYELRRKMRRVGVQVQDIGTTLCWQTYVDTPGAELGLGKLVHLAAPPDFSSLGPVNELPLPEEYAEDLTGSFNLPPGEHTYTGWHQYLADIKLQPKDGFECYSVGRLQFTSGGSVDVEIVQNRKPPKSNAFPDGDPPQLPAKMNDGAVYVLTLYLTGGHSENGGELMQFTLPLKFRPTAEKVDAVKAANAKAQAEQTVEKNAAVRTAYLTAARDRIKVASNIQPRAYAELREEERIVVYRRLIAELLDVGVTLNPPVLHKLSELLSAIFDIDQMLYFVAPEWWRPRHHSASQNLGQPPLGANQPASGNANFDVGALRATVRRKPSPLDENVVGWGGVDDSNRDNYYITEDSAPARLGSSLGWLLQLDGDNLRNAFLNAPWVKAVMPIRPGRELAALNWLSRANIEGTDGLCEPYVPGSASEPDVILGVLRAFPWTADDIDDLCSQGTPLAVRYAMISSADLTIMDTLRYVSVKVKEKYMLGQQKVSEVLDGGVTLNYLPPDRVYEFGFDPLAGGFEAEADGKKPYQVFDQWIEVLPTDQLVAVQVEYDPKTGQML